MGGGSRPFWKNPNRSRQMVSFITSLILNWNKQTKYPLVLVTLMFRWDGSSNCTYLVKWCFLYNCLFTLHLHLQLSTSYYTMNTAHCTLHIYTAFSMFITEHCIALTGNGEFIQNGAKLWSQKHKVAFYFSLIVIVTYCHVCYQRVSEESDGTRSWTQILLINHITPLLLLDILLLVLTLCCYSC